jgi:hypothetical protein
VRFLGVSNFKVKHLERCEPIRHVDSLQPHYSMLVRNPENDLIPWCRHHGTGVVSYGSLAYGILTGKFTPEATFPKNDWRSGEMGIDYYEHLFAPKAFRKHLNTVDELREIADGLDLTVAQLAVAWLLRDDAVTSAICGAKRPSQIEETAAAGDVELDQSTIAKVAGTRDGSDTRSVPPRRLGAGRSAAGASFRDPDLTRPRFAAEAGDRGVPRRARPSRGLDGGVAQRPDGADLDPVLTGADPRPSTRRTDARRPRRGAARLRAAQRPAGRHRLSARRVRRRRGGDPPALSRRR